MRNYYHVWFDRRAGAEARQFATDIRAFLDGLQAAGLIEGYSLARRKLRLGPDDLGEFHAAIEVRDLGQLDLAFDQVAAEEPPLWSRHAPLFAHATKVRAAIYREFPDVRPEGSSSREHGR